MEPPWAELTLSLGQLLLLQRERRCWIWKGLSKGNRERDGSRVEGGLHQLYPSVLVCEVPINLNFPEVNQETDWAMTNNLTWESEGGEDRTDLHLLALISLL